MVKARKAIALLEAKLDAKGIAHSKRVAALVPDELVVIALLHDVVEDSDVTVEDITAEFGEDVGVVIGALTRKPSPVETYAGYIDRLALTPKAVIVKLADIEDHLHGEAAAPKASLVSRYEKALAVLTA
jgi:(p)ppGpp synthase/HD superfamily hydrolase